MNGEILNLCGTALDSLLRVRDHGAVGLRHEFGIQFLHIIDGSPEWRDASPKLAHYSTKGPDGLLWPVWRFPTTKIDIDALSRRADRLTYKDIGQHNVTRADSADAHLIRLPLSATVSSRTDPKKRATMTKVGLPFRSERFYFRRAEAMAHVMVTLHGYVKRRQNDESMRNHGARGTVVIHFDVLAAHEHGLIRRVACNPPDSDT